MPEKKCTYKEEDYSVREDGAVLRHSRANKRIRPNDNQWQFGKMNIHTGYLEIASVTVHRIVATAFHGDAPTKGHVVDHIDTNKHNNRPENLRWLTRLENIMLNPITVKRIEWTCSCTIEDWLADPSKFRHLFQEQNFNWMRTVTAEEGQIARDSLLAWAKSDKTWSGGSLGEWIYHDRLRFNEDEETEVVETLQSNTKFAVQRNWKTISEFPCCPQHSKGGPLHAYAESLSTGTVFCRNELYTSNVFKWEISADGLSLYVMTECIDGIKPWAVAQITFENDVFVHTSLGTFFEQRGAEKEFCLLQGQEWSGGEGVDDYC